MHRPFVLFTLALFAACGPTHSAHAFPSTTQSTTQPATQPTNTLHEITLNDRVIYYHATAAEQPLTDDEGKPTGKIFYVAYEKTAGTTEPATAPASDRPITFIFNGGPGAASVWLHLGAAGPRRIALATTAFRPHRHTR